MDDQQMVALAHHLDVCREYEAERYGLLMQRDKLREAVDRLLESADKLREALGDA